MTATSTYTLDQIKALAVQVQSVMYARFVSGADNCSLDNFADIEEWKVACDFIRQSSLPLECFSDAYAKNDFKRLFSVWDSGLSSMHGKNLIQRCEEITDEHISSTVRSVVGIEQHF